jgi:hypothetical protein
MTELYIEILWETMNDVLAASVRLKQSYNDCGVFGFKNGRILPAV